MDPSTSSRPSADRQDLLHNAVLFLTDPKVQSSSLASRITFLESKGLNEGEIQEALRRASAEGQGQGQEGRGWREGEGSGSFVSGRGGGYAGYRQGYGVMMAPEPPRRDWRDLFIMAVISGGVIYGLTTLARKYLLPHLRPPSTTAFQQTSSDLTAQYDEAARLLSELQAQTEVLQAGLEGERERVRMVVDDVEAAIKSVKDGEERWREEMREIRGEVESVRELVPRMIEKHASSQSASLAELQSELRSLKTLLQSRQAALTAGPGHYISGQNDASTSNGHASVQSASVGGGGISETQRAANALLVPKGKGKGIPAWQLAPSHTDAGGSSPSLSGSPKMSPPGSTSGTTSAEGSLAGSEVLPDKA